MNSGTVSSTASIIVFLCALIIKNQNPSNMQLFHMHVCTIKLHDRMV